ncbi:hypothetical protein DW095_14655, partial [Bacteroides sp. AM07-16]
TDIEPILYEGIIWAPVNVGATEVATDLSMVTGNKYPTDLSDADVEKVAAQIGYFYQWGRNVPFKYSKEALDTVSIYPRPSFIKYAEACRNEGEYADKYIHATFWFSDYSTVFATNKEWPRENQPCPAGWHVPTKSEAEKLQDKTVTVEKGIVKFSDSNFSLSLTASIVDCEYTFFTDIDYWTSTSDGSLSFLSIRNNSYGSIECRGRVSGVAAPVRCVQDTNP